MPVYTDQTGREIHLPAIPKKIISLVPSQTELLYHLGLDEQVTGITKFCIHPDSWFRTKQRIGGTKQVDTDLVKLLQPDLIIANKEENVKEQAEALAADFPVWISDVNDLPGAYEMIEQIGIITGRETAAQLLQNKLRKSFDNITVHHTHRAGYLIWRNPYMTIGGDTFINAMLTMAGFDNVFKDRTRYPQISVEDIIAQKPALLLLSSEPYPFSEKHISELQIHLPDTKIKLVDGEMFSWYGSRLLHAPVYFSALQQTFRLL